MPSTYVSPSRWVQNDPWKSLGLPYFSYKHFLDHQFGCRVQRVSVDGGFTCPNVDGAVATGGCVFCNNQSFSPSRRLPLAAGTKRSITDQIAEGISRLQRRYGDCRHFIAYFQPATNTYGPVGRLRSAYEQALAFPGVVGLAIGTRPDCAGEPVLELLSELAQRWFVTVEYGMQTMHDRSLDSMNRGHHHDAMIDAVERSRDRGFEIGAHVIIGLPGETRGDTLATAQELARLDVDAVKIHNLYVVEQTRLAEQVRGGRVTMIDRAQYAERVVDMLEVLPPHTVIQRLGGEAPGKYFVAPSWCLDKAAVRQAIHDELARRATWQGRACGTTIRA